MEYAKLSHEEKESLIDFISTQIRESSGMVCHVTNHIREKTKKEDEYRSYENGGTKTIYLAFLPNWEDVLTGKQSNEKETG